MDIRSYTEHIGNLIGQNQIEAAIQSLSQLLKHTPQFNEVMLQSARYQDIATQIRRGVVTIDEAMITKNKVRLAILEILSQLEELPQTHPEINAELQQLQQQGLPSITNSKNVVSGSTLHAGGDIHIGDKNQQP